MNAGTTILYLPVTLIRLLKAANVKINSKYNKIKTLDQWVNLWLLQLVNGFQKKFNLEKKAIVNTYFQTETGGIIASQNIIRARSNLPMDL